MSEQVDLKARMWSIRVVVWTQAFGYIWQAAAMAIEDAPALTERAGIGFILWPLVIVMAMHLFKFDRILAARTDSIPLVGFAMLAATATLIIAILGYRLAHDLPPELISAGWVYCRTTKLCAHCLSFHFSHGQSDACSLPYPSLNTLTGIGAFAGLMGVSVRTVQDWEQG